jgi:hypothetical protein
VLAIDTRLIWALPTSVLASGVALNDCVIIAAAGPLGLWAFHSAMDANAPMDAFRAAMRTAVAGAVSILAAAALAAIALAAIHGIWEPIHEWMGADAALMVASLTAWSPELSACAIPLATAVLMALAGWRLLGDVASEFLSIGRDR